MSGYVRLLWVVPGILSCWRLSKDTAKPGMRYAIAAQQQSRTEIFRGILAMKDCFYLCIYSSKSMFFIPQSPLIIITTVCPSIQDDRFVVVIIILYPPPNALR